VSDFPAPQSPPQPFSPAPVVKTLVPSAQLIAGGPLAGMEIALRALLLGGFPSSQFTHRTMPAKLTVEGWRRLTQKTPTICLGFVKFTPNTRSSSRVWRGLAHWSAFLVVKNTTFEGQMTGDQFGCGLFGMLAVATSVLHGRPCGAYGSIEVSEGAQGFDEQWQDDNAAMGVVSFTVPFDMIDAAGLEALDDFTTLGLSWAGLPGITDSVVDIRQEADIV
jgi:hypothetical protein